MTLERLLFWLPVLAAGLGLLMAIARRLPAGHPAWRLIALVLGAAGASSVLAPEWAPWETGGVVLFAVLIPVRLAALRDRAVRQQDYVRSARVGRLRQGSRQGAGRACRACGSAGCGAPGSLRSRYQLKALPG